MFKQKQTTLDKQLSEMLKAMLDKYRPVLKELIRRNKGSVVLAQLKEKLEQRTGEPFSVFHKFNIMKVKQFLVLLEEGESDETSGSPAPKTTPNFWCSGRPTRRPASRRCSRIWSCTTGPTSTRTWRRL